MPLSQTFCADCLPAMREYPDNAFDLLIADPPYGIGASEMQMGKGKNKQYVSGNLWDTASPDEQYFKEMFRVALKVIIFGGNYFELPKTNAWIIWDKGLYGKTSFSDCEMAWTNIETQARIIQVRYDGFLGADPDGRIHITQKPIKLYEKIFAMFCQKGDKILDPFLGSGSSRIAAYDAGLDFVGYEIDAEYFRLQEERFERHTAQMNLFVDEGDDA